eukprot:COSAG03_NODE_10928_length_621_cov_0.988506_1_plen_206_part_11
MLCASWGIMHERGELQAPVGNGIPKGGLWTAAIAATCAFLCIGLYNILMGAMTSTSGEDTPCHFNGLTLACFFVAPLFPFGCALVQDEFSCTVATAIMAGYVMCCGSVTLVGAPDRRSTERDVVATEPVCLALICHIIVMTTAYSTGTIGILGVFVSVFYLGLAIHGWKEWVDREVGPLICGGICCTAFLMSGWGVAWTTDHSDDW